MKYTIVDFYVYKYKNNYLNLNFLGVNILRTFFMSQLKNTEIKSERNLIYKPNVNYYNLNIVKFGILF